MALAPTAGAGIGSVLARARNRIVRFSILDKVLSPDPGPLQPAAVALPEAPANLHIVGRHGTALELAWDVPAAGLGRTITGYNLRRNGVTMARPASPGTTVTINPTGAAVESFTVTAIDNMGVASAASEALVAMRGAPVPFALERRVVFAWVENDEEAEAALASVTVNLGNLEWGGASGVGGDGSFLSSPAGTGLALRLHENDGLEHGVQVLSQGEYRLRIGAMPAMPGGFPEPGLPGPGLPVGPRGDPNAEIPAGAIVPIRWAEVLQSFKGGDPEILAVRRAELLLTPEGATSRAYFVPVPEHAGLVALQLLPNVGELKVREVDGADAGTMGPGVLVPGQSADLDLFDPVGTDYLSAWQPAPMVLTVEGPPGVVKVIAIDPELEQAQGWEAALADGMEIPWGAQLAGYVSPDGRSAFGRRLVAIALRPGVARVGVGIAGAPETWDMRTITVLPCLELAVDANRDGSVALASEGDADLVSAAEPYRFWVNDDNDYGDTEGDDIPLGSVFTANFRDDAINGSRDLGDFFPVFLDLGEALAVLRDGPPVRVRLKQADSAVNFAYTAVDRAHAEAHWRALPVTGFGDAFDRAPGAAKTHRITAEGVLLSEAFLDGVRDHGWGVLLVEGRTPTLAPLVLEVEREGGVLAQARLELRLGNVEEMFQRVDLTKVPKEYSSTETASPEDGIPKPPGAPGEAWPDRLTNGNYFVFLHGYNVDTQGARGWQAEIFKRLHVMGSRARFVGVTWSGATGLHVNGEYLDYHKAVFNALQTGDALASALQFTGGAPVTVAAHSLGNAVVAQAIQFKSFRPQHYLMINPALPVEAFLPRNVAADGAADMIESNWTGYELRFQAGKWFKLFSEPDARSTLTWEGRYAGISSQTDVHNFYSTGEDVLANTPGMNSASIVAKLFQEGPMAQGSWKMQELAKGVDWSASLGSLVLSRGQSGWSFAPDWKLSAAGGHYTGINSRLRTPDETREISDEALRTRPFFGRFLEKDLMSSTADVVAKKLQLPDVTYDLLARAIPAKSYAAAANPIKASGFDNYHMPEKGGTLPAGHTRWRHSDLKVIALPNIAPLYLEVIAKGALR